MKTINRKVISKYYHNFLYFEDFKAGFIDNHFICLEINKRVSIVKFHDVHSYCYEVHYNRFKIKTI